MASFTASPSPPASRFPMTFMDPSFMNLSAAAAVSPPPVLPPPGPPPSSEMKNRARAWSFALRTSSSFCACLYPSGSVSLSMASILVCRSLSEMSPSTFFIASSLRSISIIFCLSSKSPLNLFMLHTMNHTIPTPMSGTP